MSQREEAVARHSVRWPIRREGTGRIIPALSSCLEGGPGLHTTSRRTEGVAHGLSVMRSGFDGFGCFATVRFPKGSAIAEYAGERINHREAMRRMRCGGGKRISELNADCYIDGSVNGNDTQYINHSCEPNADVVIIDEFMILFALQEILPGEEITVDYLNSFEEDRSVCHCRTASCRQGTDQQAA